MQVRIHSPRAESLLNYWLINDHLLEGLWVLIDGISIGYDSADSSNRSLQISNSTLCRELSYDCLEALVRD
jgi:hypothetical protein